VIFTGVKSTQLSYLSKSKDTLIENDSSESHPVKYYLSKSKDTLIENDSSESHPVKVSKDLVLIILRNHFTFLILSKPDGIILLFDYFTDSQGHTSTLRNSSLTKHLCLVRQKQ
jgi:hypothetical protein